MKINKLINIFSVLTVGLAVAGTWSCSSTEGNLTKPDQDTCPDTRVAFTTLSEDASYVIPGTDTLFEINRNAVFTAKVTLMMPANVSEGSVLELRNAILSAATGGGTVKEGIDTKKTIEEYIRRSVNETGYENPQKADSTVHILDADGFLTVNGTVASLSPRVLSYAVASYLYPVRAANGSSSLAYINMTL